MFLLFQGAFEGYASNLKSRISYLSVLRVQGAYKGIG